MPGLLPLVLQIAQGDLTDSATLAASMPGVDIVYNCAGLSADWGRWQAFYAANVQGVENLLTAAHAAGTVRRLVHVSTTDVYGYPERPCAEDADLRDTGLPYSRSKAIGDRTVQTFHRRSGLATTGRRCGEWPATAAILNDRRQSAGSTLDCTNQSVYFEARSC